MKEEEEEVPLLIEEEQDTTTHSSSLESSTSSIKKESSNNAKVPVTIITGFLGAGKSTLLTRILHEKHGKRIAVIQNELGIGITTSKT